MNFEKIIVVPKIPDKLKMLKVIGYNIWWTSNSKAKDMFSQIDEELWEGTNYNPVKLLNNVSEDKLTAICENENFINLYNDVVNEFESYIKKKDTWQENNYKNYKKDAIAYFCAEYGLHESIPIYSGGLGVLAGDHLKSASDLGIPIVGVGLLYQNGYFIQNISKDGEQRNIYTTNDFTDLPVKPVHDYNGEEIRVSIDIDDIEVLAKAWEIEIGINKLYLLDTNIPENDGENRDITDSLYGGDYNQRIKQEMLLGIGGVKLLEKLEITPSVWHINEGHSAFLVFERIAQSMKNADIDFYEALELVRSNEIFTTHTPVPAGNDMFPFSSIERYFKNYINMFKITKTSFFELGEYTSNYCDKLFSMTVLALKTSIYSNAVSQLHGVVSRELWKGVWNNVPTEEVPIDYITNGIHSFTWLAPNIKNLFGQNFETLYRQNIDAKEVWNKIYDVPNDSIWQAHFENKRKLMELAKKRVGIQREREYASDNFCNILNINENVLTIGFARRFATYKRANLIFRDIERLKKIVNNQERPVQIIFAGKAHPADAPGQEIIKNIYELSMQPDFINKIIFIENYDMNIARHMLQGVDVWLNTPRRPYEASGTSGQKAAANGILNFSVLDGWWCEGYNKDNGWAIGDYRKFESTEEQDFEESKILYNILENEIIPMYYEKNDRGYSDRWVAMMEKSMVTLASNFSMHRQVKEYYEKFYINCIKNKNILYEDNAHVIKEMCEWKEKVYANWNKIDIRTVQTASQSRAEYGEEIILSANVKLENLSEDDVIVQAYIGIMDDNDNIVEYKTVPMYKQDDMDGNYYQYETSVKLDFIGKIGYTARVIPNNSYTDNHIEMGLMKWAE
ncbi:MAG TPA: alpha-glucan phosphorylase [Clostridiales bacterium]|nr:MAG: hypothetical protein A2Y18_01105 [Clostridiales bacterium GWD2_32_19]HCC07092.1 alpha-glucan phosphorylase [Clostridiales bacterium]